MTSSATPPEHITVCMVTPSFYPVIGGLETQVERQIPFLREQGADAWVITRRPHGLPLKSVEGGVRIQRIPVPGGPGLRSVTFTLLGVGAVLRNRRSVDVLHAHSIMSPTTVATLAGLLLRRPRVVTLHARYELDHLLGKPLGALRLRAFRHVVRRFIAISDDIADLLRAQGIPERKIIRVRNGIDTARFRPVTTDEQARLRAERKLPWDAPIAIFVGRLHAVKQVNVLLHALATMSHGHLVIAGDGEERSALEALTDELGLRQRVTFAGMVSDVDAWVAAADVFVLPSASEGLSVALLEAMASGVVPVATAVGGAVDLIQDGENGFLVAPGSIDELAAALNRALSDTTWRATAALQSRAAVVEQFDLRVVAQSLVSLYRTVLSER